jgi:hypothetical protein
MTDRLEVFGFGVEIASELPEVLRVALGARFQRRRTGMRANRSYRHAPLLGVSVLV